MYDYIIEGCFYITDKNGKQQSVNFDYVIEAQDKYEAREDVIETFLNNGIQLEDGEFDIYEVNVDGSKGDKCRIFMNRDEINVVYGNKSTETQAEVFDNEEDAYAHLDFVKQKYKVAYLL